MHHLKGRRFVLAVLAFVVLHASGCGSGSSSGGVAATDPAGTDGHVSEHEAQAGHLPATPDPATVAVQPRAPLIVGTKQCARGATPGLSVYVGNDPQALVEFESWIGRPVDALQLHVGALDWDDWYNSLSWQIATFSSVNRQILWSIPLITGTGNLADAAKGTYDDRYRRAARLIADSYPKQKQIHIRVGWEFNGPWKPWGAIGKEKTFVGAYRHFVTAFRSQSDRFFFEWTPNIGSKEGNPEHGYPGDEYVDIIGMDFYYNTAWHHTDNKAAWDYMVNQPYGLKWHQQFAALHKKQTAYSEWGFMNDGSSEFVKIAAAWFREHKVVFQNYWNSNSNFRGKLSDNQFPRAGAAYKQEFNRPQACLP